MDYRPLIGVTPGIAGPSETREFSKSSNVLYCGVDYVNRIAEAGGVPVLLTITDDVESIERIAEAIDGLLLTGGEDVSPEYYGQEAVMPEMVAMKQRDHFELELIKVYLATQKPLLAICRGHQVVNVALGGTLIQDLPSLVGSSHHFQTALPPAATHHVKLDSGCVVARALGSQKLNVNSYHHQAIDRVAPSLRAVGYSEEGFVEAVEHCDHPYLVGVQWHPERLTADGNEHHLLFEHFVEACRNGDHARA